MLYEEVQAIDQTPVWSSILAPAAGVGVGDQHIARGRAQGYHLEEHQVEPLREATTNTSDGTGLTYGPG